jgi:signal transduction histidine kinase
VTDVFRELTRPWRDPQTWWGLVHLLLDLWIGIATFTTVVVLLSVSLFLLIVLPLAIPVIWALFMSGRIIGHIERSRHRALLGLELADPVRPIVGGNWWQRLGERLRSSARWKEIGYGLLRLPLGLLTAVLAMFAWSGSVAMILLPLYVAHLPGGDAKFGLFEVGLGPAVILISLVGVVSFVLAAPWLTVALVRLDIAAARLLLAPRHEDEQGERIVRLETSRLAAVDTAEAERRRIERDLHDGAQQRLVALAMGLGTARQRLETDPDDGRLVAEAHEEAKAALKEIRDLVRGIHPVILEDRGLDAALSAVVARSPVPVTLDVDIRERPSPATESTAYFVVAEALTNIARHSQATEAHVTIERVGNRLVIEVRDNGVGGADADKGSGLTGLRNRVAAHDGGSMEVVSPEGGPTTLLVEVPCAS